MGYLGTTHADGGGTCHLHADSDPSREAIIFPHQCNKTMLVEVTLFEDLLQLRVRVCARARYRIYDRPNVSKDMPEDVSFILRLRGWRGKDGIR